MQVTDVGEFENRISVPKCKEKLRSLNSTEKVIFFTNYKKKGLCTIFVEVAVNIYFLVGLLTHNFFPKEQFANALRDLSIQSHRRR